MVSLALDYTLFIQMGLFICLIFILNVFLYKPILKVMEERGKKISGLEGEAELMGEEVEKKLVGYKARIDEAKEAGNAKRAVFKKEGLDKETEILAAVHDETQKTLSDAKEKISKETETALKKLQDMGREMGRDIAQKALGRSL
ncbi:MAG: ATP synthase F0 subunit B [Proteobacteria bacterium]|nr:ATP synthase F0 subunit B [Pseudomonadota bacterium]